MDVAAKYEAQSEKKPTTRAPSVSSTDKGIPLRKADSGQPATEPGNGEAKPAEAGSEGDTNRLRGKSVAAAGKRPTFGDEPRPQGDQASMFAFWMLSCSVFTAARQLLKKIKIEEKKRRRRQSL